MQGTCEEIRKSKHFTDHSQATDLNFLSLISENESCEMKYEMT